MNQASINEHKNVHHRAHWEAKTDKLVQNHLVKSKLAALKTREASGLEERRHRLADMLRTEDAEYAVEFQANLETPEQVREKMFERMTYLKDKREGERQAEVNRRMDQRFKSTTDEVRKEDGHFYTHGTQIEREKQLIDKRRKINQTLEEEHVYAQLWALDAKKKHEREVTEAAEKAKAVAETMAVRDW